MMTHPPWWHGCFSIQCTAMTACTAPPRRVMQYDDPSSVAARVLQQKMYGDSSLYARQPTKQGVAGITREDLIG